MNIKGIALVGLVPALAGGQTFWRLPTTLGYASLGSTLGMLAVHPTGYGLDYLGLIAASTVGGGVAGLVYGYKIGAAADRRLARGEPLRLRHRNAVRFGTVFSFATIGALIKVAQPRPVVLRNGSYIEAYSSDEALLRGAAVGALAGVAVQVMVDQKLHPRAKASLGYRPDRCRRCWTVGATLREQWPTHSR